MRAESNLLRARREIRCAVDARGDLYEWGKPMCGGFVGRFVCIGEADVWQVRREICMRERR